MSGEQLYHTLVNYLGSLGAQCRVTSYTPVSSNTIKFRWTANSNEMVFVWDGAGKHILATTKAIRV